MSWECWNTMYMELQRPPWVSVLTSTLFEMGVIFFYTYDLLVSQGDTRHFPVSTSNTDIGVLWLKRKSNWCLVIHTLPTEPSLQPRERISFGSCFQRFYSFLTGKLWLRLEEVRDCFPQSSMVVQERVNAPEKMEWATTLKALPTPIMLPFPECSLAIQKSSICWVSVFKLISQ